MDATAKRQLREALESAESASSTSCGFFACPGPDKPFKSGATCHVCRTAQVLRRLAVRAGIIAADSCACCRMHPLCHGNFACPACGHARTEAKAA